MLRTQTIIVSLLFLGTLLAPISIAEQVTIPGTETLIEEELVSPLAHEKPLAIGSAFGLPDGLIELQFSDIAWAGFAAQALQNSVEWNGFPFNVPEVPVDESMDLDDIFALDFVPADPNLHQAMAVRGALAEEDIALLATYMQAFSDAIDLNRQIENRLAGTVDANYLTQFAAGDATVSPQVISRLLSYQSRLENVMTTLILLEDPVHRLIERNTVGDVPDFVPFGDQLQALNGAETVTSLFTETPPSNLQEALALLGAQPAQAKAPVDLSEAVDAFMQLSGTILTEAQLQDINDYEELLGDAAGELGAIVDSFANLEELLLPTQQSMSAAELDAVALLVEMIDQLSQVDPDNPPHPKSLTAPISSFVREATGSTPELDADAILTAVNQLIAQLTGFELELADAELDLLTSPLIIEDPLGLNYYHPVLFYIGTPGPDSIDDGILLGFDLGGDDQYGGTIGGAGYGTTYGDASSLFIDFGGNDVYADDERYDYTYGGATYGRIGMLVDVSGDDQYHLGTNGGGLGGGFLGTGVFADLGGNDYYSVTQPSEALGGGYEGIGIFADYSGDDVYEIDSGNSYGRYLGTGSLGAGFAFDFAGNDNYDIASKYCCTTSNGALGAAYAGVGIFMDRAGNDNYVSEGNPGAGSTYTAGIAIFSDLGGDDDYELNMKGYHYGDDYGNDAMWHNSHLLPVTAAYIPEEAGLLYGSAGIDNEVPNPIGGAQLYIVVGEPTAQDTVRPGSEALFEITVINRGDADASDISGQLLVYTNSGSASEPVEFSIDSIAAGGMETIYVPWTSPAATGTYQYQAIVLPAGPGDIDADNRYAGQLTVDSIKDVHMLTLDLAKTPLVPPGSPVPVDGTFVNQGNEDQSFTVTASYCPVGSCGSPTLIDEFAMDLPAPSNIVTNPPKSELGEHSFTNFNAPTTAGDYTVIYELVGAEARDGESIEIRKDIRVVDKTDFAIEILTRQAAFDSELFPGIGVNAFNAGTIYGEGDVHYRAYKSGAFMGTGTVAEDIGLPFNGQAEFLWIPSAELTPKNGEIWTYEFEFKAAPGYTDINLANNTASMDLRFIEGAIDFITFDTEEGATGTNEWEHGVSTYKISPLHADLPGSNAWVTDLNSYISSYSYHTLYLDPIDFTDYLEPGITFKAAMDTYYTYGALRVFAREAGTSDAWKEYPPVGGYSCEQTYSQRYSPGECGAFNWKEISIDLPEFSGKSVDIKFELDQGYSPTGYAGAAIDDILLRGAQRIDFDVQFMEVTHNPTRLEGGTPATTFLTLRNNGYSPISGSVEAIFSVGTTTTTQALQGNFEDIPGGEVFTVPVAWAPAASKMHFLTATATVAEDTVLGNNQLLMPIPVYIAVESLDPETQNAGDWDIAGGPGAPEWELGVPEGGAADPLTGTLVWATDLDDEYLFGGETQSYTEQSHQLRSPPVVVTGHLPGDEYVFAMDHAYEIGLGSAWYYDDSAFATFSKNGNGHKLMNPEGGYPGGCYASYYCNPASVGNPSGIGYNGDSEGMQEAIFELGELDNGDVLEFGFHIWSSRYQELYGGGPRDGWTLDGMALLKKPRFDFDLDLVSVGPSVLTLGETEAIGATVVNKGVKASGAQTIDVEAWLPSGELLSSGSVAIPSLAPGQSYLAEVEAYIPATYVGEVDLTASLSWPLDEWDINNVVSSTADVGRVFHRADLEHDNGGWTASGAFKRGAPNIDAPQGQNAFFTSPLPTGKSGSLEGPRMNLIDELGVRLPELEFRADIVTDLNCQYNGFRLVDNEIGSILGFKQSSLSYVYAFGGSAHCGSFGSETLTRDLVNRQDKDPFFEPEIQLATYNFCCVDANDGMVVDNIAVIGRPYNQNLAVLEFVEPSKGELGPGEESVIAVELQNQGLNRPDGNLAVRFMSSDVGAGGLPTLNKLVPVPELEFGEYTVLETTWTPSTVLDGKNVRVTADIVEVGVGGHLSPVVENGGSAGDNLLDTVISIVGRHDLGLDILANPSLDPDQARPIEIETTLSNAGTLTQQGVDVTIQVMDEAGTVLQTFEVLDRTKRPDNVEGTSLFRHSWTPPGVGHYQIVGTIDYPNQLLEQTPSDNRVLSFAHLGVLPYGVSDSLDEATVWTAGGGKLLTDGWGIKHDLNAPEGLAVLHTNPASQFYGNNWDQETTLLVDLRSVSSGTLSFKETYDIFGGDKGIVTMTTDGGKTWDQLGSTRVGASDWVESEYVLQPHQVGKMGTLKFSFLTDGSLSSTGWAIDEVLLKSGTESLVQGFEADRGTPVEFWDFEDNSWTGTAGTNWEVGTPMPEVEPQSGTRILATNLDGAYVVPTTPDPLIQYTESPSFTVPSTGDVSMVWRQMHSIQTSQYVFYPHDAAAVEIGVGGSFVKVTPTVGYTHGNVPTGTGWTSARDWATYEVDLTEFAGETVTIRFGLHMPATYRYYHGPAAAYGLAIDDVGIYVQQLATQPVADDAGIGSVVAPQPFLNGESGEFQISAIHNGDSAEDLRIDWTWIGPEGAILDQGTLQESVAPGGESFTIPVTAPASPTGTRLETAAAFADGRTDSNPANDFVATAVNIFGPLLEEGFEGAACGGSSPCMGWTHSASYGTDEWQHGDVPVTQFSGAGTYEGSGAFVTDILGDGSPQTYSRMELQAPEVTVPATGGLLTYYQLLDAKTTSCCYNNGITVLIDDVVATPKDGYNDSDCGYYAQYNPCDTGVSGWELHEIDLQPWAGRTIDIAFRYSSDGTPAQSHGSGAAIDNVLVIRGPTTPQQDAAIRIGETISVDPRLADSVFVTVENTGKKDIDATRLDFEWVGAVSEIGNIVLPGIAAGESRAVEVMIPGGQTSGAKLITRLQMDDGSFDQNPINDVAVTELQMVQAVAQFDPAGGAELVHLAEKGRFAVHEENGIAKLHIPEFDRMNGLELMRVAPGPGSYLMLNHDYDMRGGSVGVDIFANGAWYPLQPLGGYDVLGDDCGTRWFSARAGPQCFAGLGGGVDFFPLENYIGQSSIIRLRYEGTSIADGSYWDINSVVVASSFGVQALEGPTRWTLGGVQNENGPLEEVSQPNVWGIGLQQGSKRDGAFETLTSPVFDGEKFPRAAVEFDLWMLTGEDERLLVQQQDEIGGWTTLQSFGANSRWVRERVPLLEVDTPTQVRLVLQSADEDSAKITGLFVDNLYIGSLSGEVTPIWTEELPPVLQDGIDFEVPVRIENTGLYTNEYTLSMRGPDPYWRSEPTQPVRLQPGESVVQDLLIKAPFGGVTGHYNLQILATSTFDALQSVSEDLLVNLTVSDKPDFEVKSIGFQSSFTTEGDPRIKVEDARANTITAVVENMGRVTPTEDVIVQFLEIYEGGEIRPIDSVTIPATNLTKVQDPFHAPYQSFVSWFPRKGVIGVQAVVNPEVIGNPAPLIPEMSEHNNLLEQAVEVIPRALPELELVGEPTFSRGLLVDSPVNIGVDIRNKGAAPGTQPVDVAVLAGYEHAYLTSPVRDLPSNTLLRMAYESDLEIGADAAILQILQTDSDNPEWTTLVPLGGYPNGCILALECNSGISGTTEGRTLTYDLRAFQGDVQFRLLFAMDSHNGRVYDGMAVHSIIIEQFFEPIMAFKFTDSSSGWTSDHTWRYTPREGPIPGEWSIPRNYVNPFVVNLQTLAPLANGALDHVDLGWTPKVGGEQELLLFIDPKNLEPEFIDDENRYTQMVKVRVSGVDVGVTDCICLDGPNDEISVPLSITNTGNQRATFDLLGREHKYLATTFSLNGNNIENVELGEGQSITVLMKVVGDVAPAQAHTIFVDLRERETGKLSSFAIPAEVEASTTKPDFIGGDAITIARGYTQQFTVSNPSNGVLDVLLRIGNKPNSLAVAISPSEFSLAPFEARAVNLDLTNLGVAPGDYVLNVENARQNCAETDCKVLGTLNVKVLEYKVPTVLFDVPVGAVAPGELISFADKSTTSGSQIAAWSWDFGDGTTSTLQNPTHTFDRPGTFHVRLTITDSEGQQVPGALVPVVVTNEPPEAKTAWEVEGRLEPGVLVNFTAADSVDAEGHPLKVIWAFGDGTQGSGVDVQHAYARPGIYTVTVAVEDVFGDVDLTKFTIEVLAPESLTSDETNDESKESPGATLWILLSALGLLVRRRKD